METRRWVSIGLALGISFLLFWFVWPTPYEYTRKAPEVWRVNRFTGVQEKSTADGWKTTKQLSEEEAQAAANRQRELDETTAKLQQEAKAAWEAIDVSTSEGSDSTLAGKNASQWDFPIDYADTEMFEWRSGLDKGKRVAYVRDSFVGSIGRDSVMLFKVKVPSMYGYKQVVQEITLVCSKATSKEKFVEFEPPLKRTITRYFKPGQ